MNSLNLKHLKVLELPKVLEILASFCSCSDSKDKILDLLPADNIEDTLELLRETESAYILIARYAAPSFGSVKNVDVPMTRAESGGCLSAAELLRIGEILRVTRSLSEWSDNYCNENTGLSNYFSTLSPNKFLEDKINEAIVSEDEISDHASPELYSIRRNIRRASEKVKEQLDKVIHSQTYKTYLQEPIVTMRSGRYVIPVKAEYRSQVGGLVHDMSSTGSTVFIEPAGVVDANNEIKVLESKEKKEIERILAELSALCGEFSNGIRVSYDNILALDIIFAKAKMAYDMDASKPIVANDGITILKNARHPLLDKKKVVATNVYFGETFDTLVITGPNTGGKTVTLKTVGLLTLMAECGMFIPAGEGSKVAYFKNVLCDIGDEQSIEQSLSTFSAHMTNIIEILKIADNNTLTLIDELGAGTDPAEGAALAISILEKLRKLGCKNIATTHYAELKIYALENTGVENACCEFDVATLRPTYKLLIGMPGRSNAFAILSRLKMNEDIIARARDLVSSESTHFDEVVEKLQESHQNLEKERESIAELKEKTRAAESKANERISRLETEREKILNDAHEQAVRVLEAARAESNRMLNEMDDLRKNMRDNTADDMIRKARAVAKNRLGNLENTIDPVTSRIDSEYKLPRPLKVGDNVEIMDIHKDGVVIQVVDGDKYVTVQAGIIKTKVSLDNLRLIEGKSIKKEKKERSRHQVESRSTRSASTQLDIRGKRVDEGLMELDSFIDEAVMINAESITIIHGNGTGALKEAVRQTLKSHKRIKSFRRGLYGEGEDGVTIAELK